MTVDTSRHHDIFSPSDAPPRVDVVGAGATGSNVALQLAKLGLRAVHVWDPDVVEEHNIANQLYGPGDVGRNKAEAIADLIRDRTGTSFTAHPEAVASANAPATGFLFLLTDDMESRRNIASAYRHSFRARAIVETRMGTETGFVFTFRPSVRSERETWEATLWDDAETETTACGAPITVGPTAAILANQAVWQFMRVVNGQDYANRILFSLRPHMIETAQFREAAA